jgi:hypothetical protein
MKKVIACLLLLLAVLSQDVAKNEKAVEENVEPTFQSTNTEENSKKNKGA